MTVASPIANATTRPRLASLAEVRELPAWRESLQHLVKDHRYHEIVADTLDFESGALVLEDEAGVTLAVQSCFLVEQDLLVTAPNPVRIVAGWIRRLAPRFLRVKMLMVGCAAGEGHVTAPPIPQMQRCLQEFAGASGAWLIVWKDIPASYRGELRGLKESPIHCAHIASMPAARLRLNFSSFDDYLARRLSHATRKNLRRKFRKAAAAGPLQMTVTNDLGSSVDEALALYEQVYARSKLQFERLNKTFLQQLAERMPERVRFFLWRQGSRLVAFSLCLVHDGVLYDEYLGLDYDVALDLHLYFITFRDILTWALAQGLTAYHSTPLNYEPKLHLGFDLAPLDLYFSLPWPALSRLARPFLSRMSPTRAEPALTRFPNTGDLATGT